MDNLIIYLLQISVIFSILFLPYLFMRNDTFFIRNRIYLISTVFISVFLPLVEFEIPQDTSVTKIFLEEVTIYPVVTNVVKGISFLEITGWILLSISALFFIRMIFSIIRIFVLIMRNHKEKNQRETIVWLKEGGDFSFFNYIFLSKNSFHQYILEHERVHARRKHSIDILVFQVFKCIQWFNPLVWMAIEELKAQHEYEADESAASVNKNEYQALLLSSVLGGDLVPMTNSFHCLTIKKRFKMMNKKRNTKLSGAKLLIVLPFALLTVGLFAKSGVLKEFNFIIPEKEAVQDEEVVMPEFKGGQQAMFDYLVNNIVYPEKAKNENISGKVFVSFVVAKDGKVKDVKVVKSDNEALDAEALRVISSMPDWTPGTKGGKNADIELTLPIQFKL